MNKNNLMDNMPHSNIIYGQYVSTSNHCLEIQTRYQKYRKSLVASSSLDEKINSLNEYYDDSFRFKKKIWNKRQNRLSIYYSRRIFSDSIDADCSKVWAEVWES
jgi:3-hydroxy-3-methylglutaryl CoA synthase